MVRAIRPTAGAFNGWAAASRSSASSRVSPRASTTRPGLPHRGPRPRIGRQADIPPLVPDRGDTARKPQAHIGNLRRRQHHPTRAVSEGVALGPGIPLREGTAPVPFDVARPPIQTKGVPVQGNPAAKAVAEADDRVPAFQARARRNGPMISDRGGVRNP